MEGKLGYFRITVLTLRMIYLNRHILCQLILNLVMDPENILIIVMNIVINRINKECNMKVVFYVWLILFWAMLVLSSIGAGAYGLNLIPMVVTVMLYICLLYTSPSPRD